ncbi:glycosyltransferase [Flavobacteriaceae bacterium]|nr:glycosyltransferase [Flavobacteriaceae bacterium]
MSLKILHISTSDTGGAGLAALRLHQTFLHQNLESKFLCLEKTSDTQGIEVFPKFYARFYHRFFEYFGIYVTNGQKNNQRLKKAHKYIQPEMYSFLRSDYRINEHPLCDWADIIIIHWVAGFLDYKSFFKHIYHSKQVFWYTHDFSLILGGFHTLFDAVRFKNSPIQSSENQLKVKKRSYLKDYNQLQILANSQFSYNTITKDGFFNKKNIHFVPLGVPNTELQIIDKSIAKQALGFGKDDFLVLTVSAQLSTPLKGIDRLLEVLSNVALEISPLKVMTLGSEPLETSIDNVDLYNMGSVWNPNFKSIIFSAADVLVSSSYEETFGQTIIEGYACGTPAIVFNNGALPELVEPGKTGFIATDVKDFSKHLMAMIQDRSIGVTLGQNALKYFQSRYTSKHQVKKLIELFTSKIEEKRNCADE